MSSIYFQMSKTRFEHYAEQMGDIARAGIKAAQSLYRIINTIEQADYSTFRLNDDIVRSITGLRNAVSDAYQIIYTEAYQINPMKGSFKALGDHIQSWTGKSINDYLTDNSIIVNRTFGTITQRVMGVAISESNLE